MAGALKRIVVTGANKGIGLAITEKILSETDNTFVYLGARDAAKGEAAVSQLVTKQPSWSQRLQVLPIDVSDEASITAAAASLGHVTLYGLVNNAGISSDLKSTFATNVYGVIKCTAAFRPLLDPSGARIVHVSSGVAPQYVAKCNPERQAFFTSKTNSVEQVVKEAAAFVSALESAPTDGGAALAARGYPPADGQTTYGASKAFLNAYMLAQAAQEGPESKVLVNSCSPGFIVTDMTRGFFRKPDAAPSDVDAAVAQAGGLPVQAGANAPFALLFGDTKGSGKYFGSDCKRSPLDKYRAPGSEEYSE